MARAPKSEFARLEEKELYIALIYSLIKTYK